MDKILFRGRMREVSSTGNNIPERPDLLTVWTSCHPWAAQK